MPQRISHTLRVRYSETDQMGVVYHARYLDWFEVGRTELLRNWGAEYARLEEEKGILLPVVDVSVQYKNPARYDDKIAICASITGYSGVRIEFAYEIYNEETEQLLVTGTSRHVWVDRGWKPVRIDRKAPEIYALLGRIQHVGKGE